MEEMQKKLKEAEQRVQSLEEEKDKKREKKKKKLRIKLRLWSLKHLGTERRRKTEVR